MISGTVTDENTGLPIAGAWVYAQDGTGDDIRSVSTGAFGVHKLTGLPPDFYKIYMHNNQGYLDEWYDNLIYQGNWDGGYVSTT
ncbi:MAG: carboxypeptidase regulatory-like domain-containing protein [Actinobacteria bacterium]|nr:carboxypeptidase regulatory-like domain-containing protein [Actinomycetota bacterium]